tara:strand:- start:284 stop:694 length:411 start_codon:yes stop_codon:yes gene_type:complete
MLDDLVTMFSCTPFRVGACIGLLYASVMFPGGEGNPPRGASWLTLYPVLHRGMVVLPISAESALHIHHWMIYLPVCMACSVMAIAADEEGKGGEGHSRILPAATAGFAMVMALHGLAMYDDRFVIKTRNPYHPTPQ